MLPGDAGLGTKVESGDGPDSATTGRPDDASSLPIADTRELYREQRAVPGFHRCPY